MAVIATARALAPLVHARFRTSVSPGQRAQRLLENRTPEWQDGKAGSVLDATDLASVEVEAAGLRARHLKQSGWNQRQIAIALDAGEGTVSPFLARARCGGPKALLAQPLPGRD